MFNDCVSLFLGLLYLPKEVQNISFNLEFSSPTFAKDVIPLYYLCGENAHRTRQRNLRTFLVKTKKGHHVGFLVFINPLIAPKKGCSIGRLHFSKNVA